MVGLRKGRDGQRRSRDPQETSLQRTAATPSCHFPRAMFSSWFARGTQMSTWGHLNVIVPPELALGDFFTLQDITNWT